AVLGVSGGPLLRAGARRHGRAPAGPSHLTGRRRRPPPDRKTRNGSPGLGPRRPSVPRFPPAEVCAEGGVESEPVLAGGGAVLAGGGAAALAECRPVLAGVEHRLGAHGRRDPADLGVPGARALLG